MRLSLLFSIALIVGTTAATNMLRLPAESQRTSAVDTSSALTKGGGRTLALPTNTVSTGTLSWEAPGSQGSQGSESSTGPSYEIRLGTGHLALPQVVDNFITGERFISVDFQIRKTPGSDDFPLNYSVDLAVQFVNGVLEFVGHDAPNPLDDSLGFTTQQWGVIGSDAGVIDGQGVAILVLGIDSVVDSAQASSIVVSDDWLTLGRMWFKLIGIGPNFLAPSMIMDTIQLVESGVAETIPPSNPLPDAFEIVGGTLPDGFIWQLINPYPDSNYNAYVKLPDYHSMPSGAALTSFDFTTAGMANAYFVSDASDPFSMPQGPASTGVEISSAPDAKWMITAPSGDGSSVYGRTSSSDPAADLPMGETETFQFLIIAP